MILQTPLTKKERTADKGDASVAVSYSLVDSFAEFWRRLNENMTIIRNTACAFSAILVAGCATSSSLPDPLQAGWNGQPVCERLHEDNTQRILRCTFAPGVGHERHFHAPHFGYALIGGDVRILDESGTRDVSPPTGSFYNSDGVDWHEIMNTGSTTLTYLIIERK